MTGQRAVRRGGSQSPGSLCVWPAVVSTPAQGGALSGSVPAAVLAEAPAAARPFGQAFLYSFLLLFSLMPWHFLFAAEKGPRVILMLLLSPRGVWRQS